MPVFFIVLIIAVVVVILGLTFYYSKNAKIKRKLRKTPIVPIYNFKQGQFGRIVGKAQAINHVLTAPISGRKCLYYKVEVQKKVSSGKSSHWKTIITEELGTDFYIRQGIRNIAHVKTTHIKSVLDVDAKYNSGFMKDANSHLEQFLKSHGHESTGYFGFNKALRYHEGVVDLNEEVAVAGTGFWMMPEYPIQDLYNEQILFMQGTEQEPVYLSDNRKTTV